jgi:hypothetical protein
MKPQQIISMINSLTYAEAQELVYKLRNTAAGLTASAVFDGIK